MSKEIAICVAGSGEILDVTLLPGSTTRDILKTLKLEGYRLARENQLPFGEFENVYPMVSPGEKIYASTKAEVGRGAVMAPLRLLLHRCRLIIFRLLRKEEKGFAETDAGKKETDGYGMLSPQLPVRIIVEPSKRIVVERSGIPYWQERGWRKNGGTYNGFYSTNYGKVKGMVITRTLRLQEFYVFDPPPQLDKHPHRSCFSHSGGGKYRVHFLWRPKDLGSGIMEVERILYEAYVIG